MTHNNPFNARGATLIEILVALLILSLGVLGMTALQARAVKGNISSMQRTQAVMMSYYILDAMRVDRDRAKSLAYNTGTLAAGVIGPLCSSTAVTGTALSDNNLKAWIDHLKETVGKTGDTTTCGAVLCDVDGNCRIQIKWDDSATGGIGTQILDTSSKL